MGWNYYWQKKVVFSISRGKKQISPLLPPLWKKFWENLLLAPLWKKSFWCPWFYTKHAACFLIYVVGQKVRIISSNHRIKHIRYYQLSAELPWQLSIKFAVWVTCYNWIAAHSHNSSMKPQKTWTNFKHIHRYQHQMQESRKGHCWLVSASLLYSRHSVGIGIAAWNILSPCSGPRTRLHTLIIPCQWSADQ